MIVENKAGAGGNIGSDTVAKAKPDGYTLLLSPVSSHSINQFQYKNILFRAVEDFTPIALSAHVMTTLVVNPATPARDLKDLIAYGRANPGKLSYASGGVGTIGHLGGAMFAKLAGIEMVRVPYKGGAPVAGAPSSIFVVFERLLLHCARRQLDNLY